MKDMIHYGLKQGGGTGEAKGHDNEYEGTIMGRESSSIYVGLATRI